jgi:hypothetical protein
MINGTHQIFTRECHMKSYCVLGMVLLLFIIANESIANDTWQSILNQRLDDFETGTGFALYGDRQEMTVGEMMITFQQKVQVATNTQRPIPIFVTPSASVLRILPQKRMEGRTVVPLKSASVQDALAYICARLGLCYKVTPDGVLIAKREEWVNDKSPETICHQ